MSERVFVKKPIFKVVDPNSPTKRYTMPDNRTELPQALQSPPSQQPIIEANQMYFPTIQEKLAAKPIGQLIQEETDAKNTPEVKRSNFFSDLQSGSEDEAFQKYGQAHKDQEMEPEDIDDTYDEYLRQRGYTEDQIAATKIPDKQ